MKHLKLFSLDERSSREFDFSVFIIILCITFRNYFKGNGFAIHLTSDLFFELTLLLLPVSLLLFNKKTDKEIANILKSDIPLVFPILGGMFYIGIGRFLIYIAHKIPMIDFIFSLLGLVFLISGIINLLISILIFITKRRVKQTSKK
ncbi:hypothetical protein [Staphylococcus pettenkoferi]|uniref:hypothetical protein n=1 Tax=Staphylococcus pettenkoferi TaxID=170573 RepID=UPI001BCEC50B|nr:hypothetical protein [Staphylococcus pettenkoferi]